MRENEKWIDRYGDDNLPCSVVRDLLPAYAEEICSQESKSAVRHHLATCKDCREVLESTREVQMVISKVQEDQAQKDVNDRQAKIDAMKKVQRNLYLRRVLFVIVGILICGGIAILAIRSENAFWHGSAEGNGPVLTWNEGTNRDGFVYDGTRYVRFDDNLYDVFFGESLQEYKQAYDEDAVINVRESQGFWRWLLNENDYTALYKMEGAGGCEMYVTSGMYPAYCKQADYETVKAYYTDEKNYHFRVGLQGEDATAKDAKITVSKDDYNCLKQGKKGMRAVDVLDDCPSANLYFVSNDGKIALTLGLFREKGRWYWEREASDKQSPREDAQYRLCYELPLTLSHSIDKKLHAIQKER